MKMGIMHEPRALQLRAQLDSISNEPTLVFGISLALALFVVYKLLIYPIYFSPLAKIPTAHPLAAVTQLWMNWRRYTGREVKTFYDAFKVYGPVVRVGPNELAVNTIDRGVKTVHGHGFENFDKSQWYDFFMNYGKRNTFSSLGDEHSIRRKRVTSIYAKSFIQESRHVKAIISNIVQMRLLPLIWTAAEGNTPIDILSVNFAYGLDVVSAFVFGLSRGTNFVQDLERRQKWLEEYRKSHPSEYMFWLLEHPNLTKQLRQIGIHVVPKWFTVADKDFDKWGMRMIDAAEESLQAGLVEDRAVSGEMPIVYYQLKDAMSKEQKLEARASFIPNPAQRLELASECLDQLVATRDTFGVAFSFVLLEISKHPYAQVRLRKELRSISHPIWYPTTTSMPNFPPPQTLENIPYLHAVLKESIRLRGTVPTPNPRITPPGTKTRLGTYDNIPPGVRVSAFAWCLHRNEEVFPNPEVWIPERWMNLSKEDLEKKEKWFWAFGSGSRMCLGRNLAMEIMRYALAAIYTNFETSVVGDDGFGNAGNFITGSMGDKLTMKFTRVP